MFFFNHKKIARKLLVIAMVLCEERVKSLLSDNTFSKNEELKLRFCLSILNIVTVIWWVNIHEHNTNKARKIIDSVMEEFMATFEKNSSAVRIGDIIAHPDELKLIDIKMGRIGISSDTKSNYRSIMPIIYNSRVRQYQDALAERMKLAVNKDSVGLDPVAQLFVEHFTGDTWQKNVVLVIKLSVEVISTAVALSGAVRDTL